VKNENEFNSFLSREFKKCKGYKAVKVSDRFKIGLPDWLLFHEGRAVAAECKFAKEWKKGNMLGHAVTAPQITALEGFSSVNVSSRVVVGVADPRVIYVGCFRDITDKGNVTGEILDAKFRKYTYGEAALLLRSMFSNAEAESHV